MIIYEMLLIKRLKVFKRQPVSYLSAFLIFLKAGLINMER